MSDRATEMAKTILGSTNLGVNTAFDSVITPHDELSLERFKFHPLIAQRIENNLQAMQDKLATCKLEELGRLQGIVETLKVIKGLPQRILDEERTKRKEASANTPNR